MARMTLPDWGGADPEDSKATQFYKPYVSGYDTAPAVKPKTTASTTTKKLTTTTTKRSTSGSSSSSSSSSGGGIKKTSDKPQVSALESLLNGGFKKALDQRLANINTGFQQAIRVQDRTYKERTNQLGELRDDIYASESDTSYANLMNRARESSDLLGEAAAMGVGETDLLRSQLMAVRNWDANQGESNRAFFDSIGSNNMAISELNSDTYQARYNLASAAAGDREQAWANYANQMADSATQLGNIKANPYSDAFSKGGADAWKKMASSASTVWKNPGASKQVLGWKGSMQPRDELLNNRLQPGKNGSTRPAPKRPEGSTLKAW